MSVKKSNADSQLPGGKPFGLADLVGYAEGSVVSRTLVKSAAGNVTVFAFAAGQDLSEHSSPFDALVQVLDGTGEFTIGGKSVRVDAGEVILMPADVPHAVRAVEQFKMLLIMIRG